MPAEARSLRITDTYRARLSALVRIADREARTAWQGMDWDDLRGSYYPVAQRTEIAVRRAQTDAVRLTAGYLGAYLTSELGERVDTPTIPSRNYVGKSFGGLDLADSLQKPLISLLVANQDRKPDPMGIGLRALLVNVDLDVKQAARQALLEAMDSDDRIDGWRRAVKGTCGACAGAASNTVSGELNFPVHPGCQCVTEPSVKGLRSDHPRPTGQQIFDRLNEAGQDEMLGADTAALVRAGEIELADLVHHESPGDTPGFIVQKPLEDLQKTQQ